MAQQGFYTDPPSRRMAYDDDGSIVIYVVDNSPSIWSQATKEQLNTENTIDMISGVRQVPSFLVMVFPELRDITHSYRNLGTDSWAIHSWGATWYVSSDTTNGIDGTWTASNSFTGIYEPTSPNYRDKLGLVSSLGSKGIRWEVPFSGGFANYVLRQWHVYGNKSGGQTPHRIDFCDSSGNELTQDFDYGDQPRNSNRIWQPTETWNQSSALYLRNRSATKLAQSITVTYEAFYQDMTSYLGLSKDNVTYGTSVTYTDIQPQQTVGPIYVRHNAGISAALAVKAARLQVAVGTWV